MKVGTKVIAGVGMIAAVSLGASIPAVATVTMTAPSGPGAASTEQAETTMQTSMKPRHSVALLQESLDSPGANITIDGTWGPRTQAALQRYQRQNGLKVTGKLDQATRAMLDPIG